VKKWPSLAGATLQRLREFNIEARLDPRQRGQAAYDLYFENRCIGGVAAEGDSMVVKIIVWPGLKLERAVRVEVASIADLPQIRANLVAKMPHGFAETLSRRFVHRPPRTAEDIPPPPVDDATRLAWIANREQAAFWRKRPETVTTKSDQIGAESKFLYCAMCHVETSHVLSGQHSTARGKNWRGWQCTICYTSKQLPRR
jgi:hypothetical protein